MFSTPEIHYTSSINNEYIGDIQDPYTIPKNSYFNCMFENNQKINENYNRHSHLGGMSYEAICKNNIRCLQHTSLFRIEQGSTSVDILKSILETGYLVAPKNKHGELVRTDQYPGVYMSPLIYDDSIGFEPVPMLYASDFEEDDGEYEYDEDDEIYFTFGFSVALLKNSNWHTVLAEGYGEFVGPFAYDYDTYPNYVEKLTENGYGPEISELVFHDPISLEYAEILIIPENLISRYVRIIKKYCPHLIIVPSQIDDYNPDVKYFCVKGLENNDSITKSEADFCYVVHPENEMIYDPPIVNYPLDNDREYVFNYFKKPDEYKKILYNCGFDDAEVKNILREPNSVIEEYIMLRSRHNTGIKYPVIYHPPFGSDDYQVDTDDE